MYEKMVSAYDALAVFYRDAGDYGEALKYGILSKIYLNHLLTSREFAGLSRIPRLGPFTFLQTIWILRHFI